jgi:hypothetical protein
MSVKTSGVNFTNILSVAFLHKSYISRFFEVCATGNWEKSCFQTVDKYDNCYSEFNRFRSFLARLFFKSILTTFEESFIFEAARARAVAKIGLSLKSNYHW